MTAQTTAKHLVVEAERVPAGMIRVGGQLLVRRHGLVRPRNLTCIHGHKVTVRGRPFEISIPCGYKLPPDWRTECEAMVFVITTRHRGALWMMDVNAEEDAEIDAKGLDVVAIMERFGVGIPRRRYQDRHAATHGVSGRQ